MARRFVVSFFGVAFFGVSFFGVSFFFFAFSGGFRFFRPLVVEEGGGDDLEGIEDGEKGYAIILCR